MAESKDDGGGKVVESFTNYIQRCGAPLLGIDQNQTQLKALGDFLGEDANCTKVISKLCKGEIASFTLEMKTPSKSKGDDESGDKDQSQPVSKDSIEFAAFDSIPSSAFEGGQSDYDRNYLLFTNVSESGTLQDPAAESDSVSTGVSMSKQVLISTFDAAQPMQSILPYIRHTFMPIATLRAQREEKQQQVKGRGDPTKTSNAKVIMDKLRELELKLIESQDEDKLQDVVLRPIPEISQWLDQLQDVEKERIMEAHQKQKYDIAIPDYLQNNQQVIARLLRKLRDWKDEATKVTKRKKASAGRVNTVQQEIKFWNSKMEALNQIEAQLQTVGVCATMLVLHQNNKRVQARAFGNSMQVTQARKEVQLHNEVLSTFPIKTLQQSGSVRDIIKAINEIFQHLDAFKLKNNYPVDRIADLAQAAARDVSNQLRDVLSRDIMAIKYSLFVQKTADTERLFHNFQSKYTKLRSDLRQRELLENRQRGFTGNWHRDQETDLKVSYICILLNMYMHCLGVSLVITAPCLLGVCYMLLVTYLTSF